MMKVDCFDVIGIEIMTLAVAMRITHVNTCTTDVRTTIEIITCA